MGFLSGLGDFFSGSSGGGLLSSITDGVFGIIGQNSANAKNKRQWQRERSWEEEKMRNAHQWEAEDLKAAGLNPTLTAGGNGAVGSGSPHAEMGAGSFGNFGKNFISNIGTLESLHQAEELNKTQGFKNIMEGIKAGNEAEAIPERVKNETRDTATRAAEQQAEEKRINAEIEERNSQTLLNTAYTTAQEIENDFNNGDFIKALKKINTTIDTLENAGSAVSSVIIKPFTMLAGVKSAKDGRKLMKEFKETGVFDIMKHYAKNNKRKYKK